MSELFRLWWSTENGSQAAIFRHCWDLVSCPERDKALARATRAEKRGTHLAATPTHGSAEIELFYIKRITDWRFNNNAVVPFVGLGSRRSGSPCDAVTACVQMWHGCGLNKSLTHDSPSGADQESTN